MPPTPFSLQLPIRMRDIDCLGHVNNCVYFDYMETARAQFCIDMLGLDPLLDYVLASTRCDFRSPVLYGELLAIQVLPTRVGRTSFDLSYTLTAVGEGRLVAEGHSVQVKIERSTMRPVPIPTDCRERLRQLL